MGKIVVFTNLTLDGVMQAPARPEEDPRGGFEYGGWAAPFGAMQEVGDALGDVGALLFGRWTYEAFFAFWPKQPENPFTAFFDNIQKYVASKTLKAPLPWVNSTLLEGGLGQAIRRLKDEEAKNIVIFGSGTLIQSLMRHQLVDRYVLLIHPLVLGAGRRLFLEEGPPASLRLVQSWTTARGVVIAAYEPSD